MRIAGALIFILLFTNVVLAQDSTQISYSEIQDTLVKQRFIDRYENVFMTKVPTRHMFKVGVSEYYQAIVFPIFKERPFNNLSLNVGYEFKLLPEFSIAISGHIPNYGASMPLNRVWSNTVLDAQLRWFFDMKHRIRTGKNANNFSGNYVAINYTIPGTDYFLFLPSVGLKFGFQRRFFNSGFMDFALALHQQAPWFRYGLKSNWSLSSQASFGFAFGDWKKAQKPPICDVLFCNENFKQQWKIKLPELTVGYDLNRLRAGFAYERRIKNSPFSINFQLDIGLSSGLNYFYSKDLENISDLNPFFFLMYSVSKEANLVASIQPRYYFLQNRQQIRGRNNSGMSSFYTAINIENSLNRGKYNLKDPFLASELINIKRNTLHIGPMLGFQQRVFKNGYIDLNTSYNYKREFYNAENSFGFRGNLSVGFAF